MKYRFDDGFFFFNDTGISVLFPDCYCLASGGSHHIWCDIMQIFASVVGAVFKIMHTQTGRFYHNPDEVLYVCVMARRGPVPFPMLFLFSQHNLIERHIARSPNTPSAGPFSNMQIGFAMLFDETVAQQHNQRTLLKVDRRTPWM